MKTTYIVDTTSANTNPVDIKTNPHNIAETNPIRILLTTLNMSMQCYLISAQSSAH